MPGAYTQRDWENSLVLERQGENICVPELLKKIKLMGEGRGWGRQEEREWCCRRVCMFEADGKCTHNWRCKSIVIDFPTDAE